MEKIQAIIFNKHLNTLSSCLKWLHEHDFKFLKIHETTNYYRFRLIEPNILKLQGYNIFRDKLFDENKKIYFIMAYKINNKHELIYNVDSKIYNLEA